MFLHGEVRGWGSQHRLPGVCGQHDRVRGKGGGAGTHPGTGGNAGAGERGRRPGALAYFKLVKGKQASTRGSADLDDYDYGEGEEDADAEPDEPETEDEEL